MTSTLGTILVQVCSVSDIKMHFSLKAKDALERCACHRVNVLREDLIEVLRDEIRRRVVDKEVLNAVELRMTAALSLGQRERVRIDAFLRALLWHQEARRPEHFSICPGCIVRLWLLPPRWGCVIDSFCMRTLSLCSW